MTVIQLIKEFSTFLNTNGSSLNINTINNSHCIYTYKEWGKDLRYLRKITKTSRQLLQYIFKMDVSQI